MALLLPILKDMAPEPPPILSIIFFVRNCPRAMKITMGRTQVSRMDRNGEVSSTISLEKTAPASYSRSVLPGSSIRPVL